MLSRISGKSIPQEARPATTSYNLVRSIRVRRYKFLGNILRSGTDRLVYHVVTRKFATNEGGSILMDAPPHTSIMDLTNKASDKKVTWNAGIVRIP